MRIEKKEWDSEVLGARCGEVYCDPYDKSIRFDEWDFLHCRPLIGQDGYMETLWESDFIRVAVHILLKRDLRAFPPDPKIDFPYRKAKEADARHVGSLASAIFSYDRLHADRRVPWHKANAYKRAWGENLCRGYADYVFIAANIHGIIGFSSVRGNSVGLNGVHPKYRRRGIGSGLIELACKHLADQGYDYAFVSTQRSNMPALNMYYRKGHFRIVEMAYDFHWIRPGLRW